MKKIVIVGANSYIARNMTFVMKREKKYSDCEIKLYDREKTHIDGVENYKSVDILDKESVDSIDFDCDIMYFFVGKTGSANGFDDFNIFIDVNEKGLLNLLNAYRNSHSKAKIIFPSTRLVYKGKEGLLKEDDDKDFKTIYAMNKYACEKYLEQYHNFFDVKYCIFRICVPYGTLITGASSYGTAEFMIGKAEKGENISLYGDGLVRRTLIYMEDLCYALIEGGMNEKCINDVFNIGGENYSLKEIAQLVCKSYSVGIEYVEYPEIAQKIESGDTVFDDGKLQNICPIVYRTKFKEWCQQQNQIKRGME